MKELEAALNEMECRLVALDELDANQQSKETVAILCAIEAVARVVRALAHEARAADKSIYELSCIHP